MLFGLQDVDWPAIRRVLADEVPELLTAAAAGDADALGSLLLLMWRGERVGSFEAIAKTMPFLIELFAVPSLDRVDLATVLLEVHRRFDLHRADLQFWGDPETRDLDDDALDEIPIYMGEAWSRREREWLQQAQAAVYAGIPTYVRLLTDQSMAADEALRAWAAYLLGLSVARDCWAIPAMVERSCDDPSSLVRASLIFALTECGGATDPAREVWLADPSPLCRLAGALTGPPTARLAAVIRQEWTRSILELTDDAGQCRLPQARQHTPPLFLYQAMGDRRELQLSMLMELLDERHDRDTRWSAIRPARLLIMD